MSDKSRAKLILERWLISIKREDRKHDNMPGIFENLAGQFFSAGIPFEIAYELMKLASRSMYPVQEVTKYVYAKSPTRKYQTYQEFVRFWQETLDKSALEAFYGFYDIEGLDPGKIPPTAKKLSVVKQEEHKGMVTEDELNEDDYWKSVKSVSRNSPWLFLDGEDQTDDK